MDADGSSNDGGQYIEETETKYIYDVKFYTGFNTETIRTTVPLTTSAVDDWIDDVEKSFARQLENNNLIRNEVVVLQLCLAHQCLIFQFFGLFGKSKKLQKFHVPESLAKFLNDERIIFVGSGIDQDARKLMVDHGLTIARSEELAGFAEYKLGREDLYKAGLKKLMWEQMGPWSSDDVGNLTCDQINYACLDAYASFKIGMDLMHRRPKTVNKKGFNGNPQKDFNKAPQETNQGQGPKTGNQGQGARVSYKESNRSKPTLMDYWK
ncbi:hypothetical protein MKW98_005969 [Papaver atlanticum]|uniref:3'-5' exonuclease domain-containing protein n=1 Tax=Papaver atlanticum TaxID=357466 RepID=A0AAD4S7W0_9MAGN|nr:hypothetical protein MKW98_005969 [Papaver atlanticum]